NPPPSQITLHPLHDALPISLADIAYNEAKKSGEFTIPGIGKLVKQHRKARDGRNPATGETIKIPAKTVIKFRVAKAAKDSVLTRSEEHTSELQSRVDLVCRL